MRGSCLLVIMYIFSALPTSGQKYHLFQHIDSLLRQKQYFEAGMIFRANQDELTRQDRLYVAAVLGNAFNKPDESGQVIDDLLPQIQLLPDSAIIALYKLKKDNHVKLFEYKEASEAAATLLGRYKSSLTSDMIIDLENDIRLWGALANEPKQTVSFNGRTLLQMTADKAGLKNLRVTSGSIERDFVFDTGANISTVTLSTAKAMGMKIIPAAIAVRSITGNTVFAQLAVCKKLALGNMEFNHVVFLVFEDEALAFRKIRYQIDGILGFPVIRAMKKIAISKEGIFDVDQSRAGVSIESNMALDGLRQLLFVQGQPYTFDSGADKTILYKPYYLANQAAIESLYKETTISLGGAGGARKMAGYLVDVTLKIGRHEVVLHKVKLLKESHVKSSGIYGNIGQDVIGKFRSMVIDFDEMYVHFDN